VNIVLFLISTFIFFSLYRNLEYRSSYRENWKNLSFHLWQWIVIWICLLLPIINIIGVIFFIIGVTLEVNGYNPDMRFKKTGWLKRFLDFMNKEI